MAHEWCVSFSCGFPATLYSALGPLILNDNRRIAALQFIALLNLRSTEE